MPLALFASSTSIYECSLARQIASWALVGDAKGPNMLLMLGDYCFFDLSSDNDTYIMGSCDHRTYLDMQ